MDAAFSALSRYEGQLNIEVYFKWNTSDKTQSQNYNQKIGSTFAKATQGGQASNSGIYVNFRVI